MGIFKSLKFNKRRKELRESLQNLINLIIVVENSEKQDLHTYKSSDNTTLSYASSFQRLLKKCQSFKEKENKEIELSVVYSLYYALTCLYTAKYDSALENIKAVLDMTMQIDDELRLEARYMHYIATIMLTHIVGQEVYESLENKYKQEKLIQREIEKKLDNAEKLLDNFNSKRYDTLGESKLQESKLRVLENQKKLLTEYFELENEINGNYIPKEFVEILLGLEENLDFIENEMLTNKFLTKEEDGDNDIFYPTGYLPNLIYLYLQTQRAKSLFYRKEYTEFNIVIEQLFHHTNYSNWTQPALVLKNGNREETLSKIQNYNNLTSFNEFVDTLVFEKQKAKNGEILIIRNRKEAEELNYIVKEVS